MQNRFLDDFSAAIDRAFEVAKDLNVDRAALEEILIEKCGLVYDQKRNVYLDKSIN